MQLSKNQYVLFENGEKHGWLEARWSERSQAFYTFVERDGERVRLYSTDIREKPTMARKPFVPSAKTCTMQIFPVATHSTDNAYAIEDGSNGKVSRGKCKAYYRYIAKSICYVDDRGNIFAPVWA